MKKLTNPYARDVSSSSANKIHLPSESDLKTRTKSIFKLLESLVGSVWWRCEAVEVARVDKFVRQTLYVTSLR